jgi:hypothetical protein
MDFETFINKYSFVNSKFVKDFYNIIKEDYIERYSEFLIDSEILRKWLDISNRRIFNDTIKRSYKKKKERPKKEEKTNTGGSVPNIDPVWVRKPEWEEHEFNAKTVGKVIVTQEKTIIFVNRDYFRLDKALSINGLTERQIDMRAERYIVPVAVALYMQDLDMKALPDSENRPSDEFLIRSNDYMAEAVLAAMHSDIEVAGEMERDA